MKLTSDFADLLRALNGVGARYLVVGAHALAYHGRPRATADLDVWVEASPKNAVRVRRALANFGAPLENLSVEDLCGDDLIFQIGVPPLRVDIITGIDGVTFSEAWPRRVKDVIDGIQVAIIGREDFIRNKKAAGRLKDLADVEALGAIRRGKRKR
jgi:predicted nucleotidyltransferase